MADTERDQERDDTARTADPGAEGAEQPRAGQHMEPDRAAEERAEQGRAARERIEARRQERSQARRARLRDLRARIVRVASSIAMIIAVVFAVVLAFRIVFAIFPVNPDNALVEFVGDWADALVLFFGHLFTPDDARVAVLVNYGLAAVFWLVVGRIAVGIIRRLG